MNIFIFSTLKSTQDTARSYVNTYGTLIKVGEFIWFIAQEQTAGYGTRGRSWFSPKGSISASVVFRVQKILRIQTFAAMVGALSVGDILKETIPFRIKWPNDLISLKGEKIAGCLAEILLQDEDTITFVLGIGVNVNNTLPKEEQFSYGATSLRHLTNQTYDLAERMQTLYDAVQTRVNQCLYDWEIFQKDLCKALGWTTGNALLSIDQETKGWFRYFQEDGGLCLSPHLEDPSSSPSLAFSFVVYPKQQVLCLT